MTILGNSLYVLMTAVLDLLQNYFAADFRGYFVCAICAGVNGAVFVAASASSRAFRNVFVSAACRAKLNSFTIKFACYSVPSEFFIAV